MDSRESEPRGNGEGRGSQQTWAKHEHPLGRGGHATRIKPHLQA